MGCDIHVYAEKLYPDGWKFVPPPEIELYYYPQTMTAPAMGEYWYWGRNYSLFTFLAGVRDDLESYLNPANPLRSMFPDLHPKEDFDLIPKEWIGTRNTPLSEPRGIPEDVSPEVLKEWNEGGDHTPSWFTARELQAVNYDTSSLIETALVYDLYPNGDPGRALEFARQAEQDLEKAWDFLTNTGEGSMCQGTNAPGYRRVAWRAKLRSVVGKDWFDFLDRLSALTADDGSDVRTVFWFDS